MELNYIPLQGFSWPSQSSSERTRDGSDYPTSRGAKGDGKFREGA